MRTTVNGEGFNLFLGAPRPPPAEVTRPRADSEGLVEFRSASALETGPVVAISNRTRKASLAGEILLEQRCMGRVDGSQPRARAFFQCQTKGMSRMSTHTIRMNDQIDEYLLRVSLRESDVQRRLREETATLEFGGMQISPVQGQLMRMLAGLVGARRAIEVGVFTGYSALCVALALPEDGELIACDVNEEWTAIARRFWSEAGVASRITLKIAPAVETLDSLIRGGRTGEFDFAFIDADKTGYDMYYERCLELLRPGGLALFDNVLWGGAVADESDSSEDTEALRVFNARISDDPRIELCMLPVGDGLTIARKLT